MKKSDQASRRAPGGTQYVALAGLMVHSLRRTYAFAGKVLARSGVHVFDANN